MIWIFDWVIPDLPALILIRPPAALVRRPFQGSDLPPVLFVLLFGKRVLSCLVFPPYGKISALYLDGLPVQNQHMIHTGIQDIPVMRNQKIPSFSLKIFFNTGPGFLIQMIGRLIDQEKILFFGK